MLRWRQNSRARLPRVAAELLAKQRSGRGRRRTKEAAPRHVWRAKAQTQPLCVVAQHHGLAVLHHHSTSNLVLTRQRTRADVLYFAAAPRRGGRGPAAATRRVLAVCEPGDTPGTQPDTVDHDQNLLDAAMSGDVAAARVALDGGANIECKGGKVRPAVCVAVRTTPAARLRERTW